jgi:phosphatidylglycerol:prolipoprotein diacylglycerol transferase
VGLLIGGRLGYILFYDFSYYWQSPLAIISPIDPITHQFIGIYGMSYHGALLGALLAGWIYTKIKKLNFWRWANFIAPAVPAGYFFGRMGNLMNGELYGRLTDKSWGMYFPSDPFGLLRHPSELYEAGLEGTLLFLILWKLRQSEKYKNHLLALYIMGYALVRIIAEFFREPDAQIGYLFLGLTLGQILSLGMLILGLGLFSVGRKRKSML